MSKIKQFFRQSGLTKAQLISSLLCYFFCFALFLGIVVIWNPLSLSSTPTEDSQAADGPTNTSGSWITDDRYSIDWFKNAQSVEIDGTSYQPGTEQNPYTIASAEDLAGLSWLVYTKGQADNPLKSGTDYSGNFIFQGKYFKQTVNIDLSLFYWQPIGIQYTREGISRDNYFAGSYDGGNHKVSGVFTPAGSGNGYAYQGLFGYVYSSISSYPTTIQNIGITNSFIRGYGSVGGVVGYAYSTTITNCYNTGSVTGSSYVGGVVGYAYASSGTTTITNCYNTGSVTNTATSFSYVGGVVGRASGNDTITITNCYNTGSVSGSENVGGVVGYAGGATITNCYNTGSVKSTGSSVGGVVGYASNATIANCYNTGNISSTYDSTTPCVGGVVGSLSGTGTTTVLNNYNFGSISYANSSATAVGGIIGDDSSTGTTTITNNFYGVNCGLSIGGVNGADTDGQAEDDPNLTTETPKEFSWYNDPTNWNSSPWDFEEIWTLDAGRNGGYPSFNIDYWISDPSYYSIEWFTSSDKTTYGDGSASNPYIIDSAEDLAGLSWLVYTRGDAENTYLTA